MRSTLVGFDAHASGPCQKIWLGRRKPPPEPGPDNLPVSSARPCLTSHFFMAKPIGQFVNQLLFLLRIPIPRPNFFFIEPIRSLNG